MEQVGYITKILPEDICIVGVGHPPQVLQVPLQPLILEIKTLHLSLR